MSGGSGDLAARLQSLLRAAEPGREPTVTACRRITGGYSRVTARADVRWHDGAQETLVVRLDPPEEGEVFTSDRDAEWRLLGALAARGGVRVAEPRYCDRTGEHLGVPGFVSAYCPGRPLQALAAEAEAQGRPDLVRQHATLFADTLAGVHGTPLDTLPAELPRPADRDAYLDGVVERYERTAAEVSEHSPVLRYVAAWLRRHRPPPLPLTLVHGDWQPANVLVPEDGAPVVIDWEFAHVGDPREDLGYYTQIPFQPHLYRADPTAYLGRYRELTGLTSEQVDEDAVDYFLLVGMAELLTQLLRTADAVASGRSRGALGTYLINAVTHQYDLFLDVCTRLDRVLPAPAGRTA